MPRLSPRYPVRTLLALTLGLVFAGAALADEITVFAAASLKNALEEVAHGFERETGHTVRISLAGSSALARQIELGAPADLFISANEAWMDRLQERGRIAATTRSDLLANRLVLIAHGADAAPVALTPGADLAGRLGNGRLAMALVDAVPAGIYGKAALTRLGLWEGLAPHVAQADNVRAALALVALGEAPLGIVYATDAQAEPRVSIVAAFPEDSHPPIRYPVAIVTGHERPETLAFLDHLHGPTAAAIFAAQGFTVLEKVAE